MDRLSDTVVTGFVNRYTELGSRVNELGAGLTEEQFWAKPFAFGGNSFGHLLLHLTGNLSYYIGAQVAGAGYTRERDREFTEPTPPSKAWALNRFDIFLRCATHLHLHVGHMIYIEKEWKRRG
jgi:hypothetical protein